MVRGRQPHRDRGRHAARGVRAAAVAGEGAGAGGRQVPGARLPRRAGCGDGAGARGPPPELDPVARAHRRRRDRVQGHAQVDALGSGGRLGYGSWAAKGVRMRSASRALLLSAALALLPVASWASPWRMGLKTGLSLSNIHGDFADAVEPDYQTGFQGGGFVELSP